MAKIAFLGLGQMGTPMATRLLQAGYQLTVWNRTPERGKPLEAAGATVARSPAEAGAGSNAGRPTWIIRRWWQQSLERSQSPSVILYTRPGARRPAGGSGPRECCRARRRSADSGRGLQRNASISSDLTATRGFGESRQ